MNSGPVTYANDGATASKGSAAQCGCVPRTAILGQDELCPLLTMVTGTTLRLSYWIRWLRLRAQRVPSVLQWLRCGGIQRLLLPHPSRN